MGKKGKKVINVEQQIEAGAETGVELEQSTTLDAGVEQSTTLEEQSAEPVEQSEQLEAGAETPEVTEPKVPRAKVVALGIGEFVRFLLLNSSKSNEQVLQLVHARFPAAKTTPACIAWYKTDLRKKGLLGGLGVRGQTNKIEFSDEELKALIK